MTQVFEPGDYLIFQLESGYGLLRVLAVEDAGTGTVWHVLAYSDLFLDVDMADAAIDSGCLTVGHPHIALTDRAFESTQVSKMQNKPLNEGDLDFYRQWQADPAREVSDRSVRLMLGLR